MVGILSDFGYQTNEEAIKGLIQALKIASPNSVELKKYLEDFQMLARIRDLEGTVKQMIKNMALNLDWENSPLYQRVMGQVNKEKEKWAREAREKGREEARQEFEQTLRKQIQEDERRKLRKEIEAEIRKELQEEGQKFRKDGE